MCSSTPSPSLAAIWLLERGLADAETVGAFVTPAVMVDILSELIDHPDEQFLAGRALAKQARKAALRHCGTAAGLPTEAHRRDDASSPTAHRREIHCLRSLFAERRFEVNSPHAEVLNTCSECHAM